MKKQVKVYNLITDTMEIHTNSTRSDCIIECKDCVDSFGANCIHKPKEGEAKKDV